MSDEIQQLAQQEWEAVRKRRDHFYPIVKVTQQAPTYAQESMRTYLEAEDGAQLKSLIAVAVRNAHDDPKWFALVMAYAYGKPTEAMKLEVQSTMKRILVTDGKPLDDAGPV